MIKLEGDLQEIELVSHLLELADERFTGAIRFENDGIIKILYFKNGDVLSASTNDRADSVDEILLRAGKVNRDHVRQALGKRKDNETLGDALLSMGFISRKELTWGRRTQIVGILRSVANWPEGSYQIVHDYLPNREEGTLFYLPQIILELAVTDPDKGGIEKRIEGGVTVFRKLDVFKERYSRLALNEDADAIVEQIDGERTAAEVAAVSKLDVFAAYKLLLALESLGMLDRDKPEVVHEVLLPSVPASLPPALAEPALPFSTRKDEPPPIEAPPVGGEDRGAEEPYADAAWTSPDLSLAPEDEAPAPPAVTVAAPVRRKRSSRSGLLFGVIVIAVLAAAAWGGYAWWRETLEPEPKPAAARPQPARPVAPPITEREVEETVPVPVATPPAVVPKPTAPAPVAAAQPASDPERARFDRMAEAFAREGSGVAYALQFELVCQTESVARALAEGPKVWFVPIEYRGQSCFRVFWGRYETREAAERAREEIPASLRGSGPVVVRPRELVR